MISNSVTCIDTAYLRYVSELTEHLKKVIELQNPFRQSHDRTGIRFIYGKGRTPTGRSGDMFGSKS